MSVMIGLLFNPSLMFGDMIYSQQELSCSTESVELSCDPASIGGYHIVLL